MIIFNSYVSHSQRVPCFFGGFFLGWEDPELHPEQQTLVEECLQTLVFSEWLVMEVKMLMAGEFG